MKILLALEFTATLAMLAGGIWLFCAVGLASCGH
jgi:hypothetical protein